MNRNVTIVISVIALHVAVLWAMQTGLLRRVADVVMPAEILVSILPAAALTPSIPAPRPVAQAPSKTAPSATSKPAQTTPARPVPAATPLATSNPLALAPTATSMEPNTAAAAAPAATAANTATGSKATPQSGPAAAPKVELPSSSADYLNNPKPPYPALSKRMGEQGKVLVRVWINTDGVASQPAIKASSGFDRLDQAAITTVLGWRYVPGKRGGVPEAMWFDVPVNWVLQ